MNTLKLLSILAICISLALVANKLYRTDSWIINPSDVTYQVDSVKSIQIDSETQPVNPNHEKKASAQREISTGTFTAKNEETISPVFWVKVFFSGIFCLAALYVVLSNKYNDETKKWAFSVLTLIAGVWIGTTTKS